MPEVALSSARIAGKPALPLVKSADLAAVVINMRKLSRKREIRFFAAMIAGIRGAPIRTIQKSPPGFKVAKEAMYKLHYS